MKARTESSLFSIFFCLAGQRLAEGRDNSSPEAREDGAGRETSTSHGHKDDPHGPDRGTLLLNDWAVRRAELDHWLEQQPKPELVFVRYSRWHNVNNEWVYNHADIMHSRVIWARDLGADHNKLLLSLLADRTAWLLEADAREPQLVPYAEAEYMTVSPSQRNPGRAGTNAEQDEQTNW